ncbi:M48 family metallopeptidase [Epilithonimonas xixisoli]|uniref:Peptidase M48-like protein n=1 Tax=Epilithonimonas xixisoli TaxID=1476462 RepID=A0A4R8I7J3_9FLAO|nr:M48 family metallopeptidase [Epilithonimonas xixisoli]TDX84629.1 peptidase M48-like protein [Epilithonimonas xixisoli]
MKIIKISALAITAFGITACVTNPVTGRSSIQIANNSQIATAAAAEYRTTLSGAKVVTGTADANRVKNVGAKIKNAAYAYYKSIGRESDLANYSWEFNLIQDAQLNAWCMPGGKVAFYTGIMPICKDENGVAVVMGHEVSHALAGHGNERVSQAMIAQYGSSALGSGTSNSQLINIVKQVYPYASQGVLLKYGRSQELEADQMGLYLMAMAGYDPRTSTSFWQRMEAASTGNRAPEFLSTHPNPQNRISDLNANMPKALEYYKAAGGKL